MPLPRRKFAAGAVGIVLAALLLGLISRNNNVSQLIFSIFQPQQRREITNQVRTLSLVGTLDGHTDAISSIAISPDGTSLVSGSHDSTVRVWDIKSGENLYTLNGHEDSVLSIAISEPDGQVIASGGIDGVLRRWKLQTGEEITSLEGEGAWITSLAFDSRGQKLISGRTGNKVDLWNHKSNEVIASGLHDQPVLAVAAISNLGLFASGSSDRTIRLWNLISGEQKRLLEGHTGWVTSLAFDPESNVLVSGSMDGTIRLWSLETPTARPRVLRAHSYSVSSVAVNPQKQIIASGGFNGEIRIWDLQTSKPIHVLSGEHVRAITSLAFSPDGTTLISGSADTKIKIWR